jgi:hypothetical protein
MQPLTPDDLLPLDEFAARRSELFRDHCRYLDRYRRVTLGPRLTLVFENRQTLWFRAQDVLRVARLSEPDRVAQELALFNRLLPGRRRLQAAVLIHVAPGRPLTEELAPWQALEGERLCLHVGARRCPANLLTCRPEDRCIGTAHWAQFVLDSPARRALADFHEPAYLRVVVPGYAHDSGVLSEEVRQSLLDDMELSDRAA